MKLVLKRKEFKKLSKGAISMLLGAGVSITVQR